MKIDFSWGIDAWKAIINTFLAYLNDFWTALTGSPLFTDEATGELFEGEEPTSLDHLDI